MRVRKLDANGDMTFGREQINFYKDDPVGVAQNVSTRLRLWLGEWFLNVEDGMPWLTQVIGKYTTATRDFAITQRILGTPGVLSIATYGSQLDRDTRQFDVQSSINTIYGPSVIPKGPY